MIKRLMKNTEIKDIFLDVFSLLLPIVFVCFFVSFQETKMYNNDEGLELIKAVLLQKGYSLYETIWSDQPPVYTWLLSTWSQIFGKTVASARVLTLLFSAFLLFSFRRIIAFYFNRVTSIYSVITLFFSKDFIQLSVSVTQAIPSLSLGIGSLYFLSISLSSSFYKKILLILSGILLGTAIQLKFWIVVLIPAFLLYMIYASIRAKRLFEFKARKFEEAFDILTWSVSLIATIFVIAWWAQPFSFKQLLVPHLQDQIYEHLNLVGMFSSVVRLDRAIFIFAFAGFFLACISWKKEVNKILMPTLWLVSDFVFFWNHRPIWNHYYPIFAIPLVWLSSYFFWWSWSILARNISLSNWKKVKASKPLRFSKSVIHCSIATLILGASIYSIHSKFNYYSSNAQKWENKSKQLEKIILAISNYREQTNWIYTDTPILAVYTNLLIPPEVAVITKKRFSTSDYEKKLISVFQSYQPEQLVFINPYYRSLPYNPQIKSYIENYYKPVTKNSNTHHYILKDLDERKEQ